MKVNTEILTDYLNEKCNEKTKEKVEKWIEENPRNRRYFEELQFYWESKASVANQISFDAEEGFRKLKEKKAAGKQLFLKKAIRYAAIITLLLATSLTFLIIDPFTNQIVVENQDQMEQLLELPDGTTILLAQGGSVEYPKEFSNLERLVHLSGEAFFEVAKDKSKPFIITTKHTKTSVIGTSFRITEDESKTSIQVESGIVEFMATDDPANKVKLVKGEIAKFVDKQQVVLKGSNEANNDQLKIKYLKYQNEKLAVIIKDLNEIFHQDLRIEGNQTPLLSITAIFEDQDLESILESISFTLNLEVEKNKDYILLK